ncbi:MAG: ElyC/SanA/YdcF family protein [Bacteroidota bacterium]
MIRKVGRILVWILSTVFVFILFANVWIVGSTRSLVYNHDDLFDDGERTLLILGTSDKTIDGGKNSFFYERIATANRIYQKGRIKRIILSGSKTKYYNEPDMMRNALKTLGIPDSVMIDDDSGDRTLDSIVRSKEVYKEEKLIIITQEFHAYRALFISWYFDLDAIVRVTNHVISPNKPKVLIREFFARPLAVIDLYVLKRRPQLDSIGN